MNNDLMTWIEQNGPIKNEEEYLALKQLIKDYESNTQSVLMKYINDGISVDADELEGELDYPSDPEQYEKLKQEILMCAEGYTWEQIEFIKERAKQRKDFIESQDPNKKACEAFWDDNVIPDVNFEQADEYGPYSKYRAPDSPQRFKINRLTDYGKSGKTKLKVLKYKTIGLVRKCMKWLKR